MVWETETKEISIWMPSSPVELWRCTLVLAHQNHGSRDNRSKNVLEAQKHGSENCTNTEVDIQIIVW